MVSICLAISACSTGPDQEAVVGSVAIGAIIPNLELAVGGMEELDRAVSEYCASPGPESLDASRKAWLEAKSLWEPAQPNTFFDPGDMLRTVSKVDYTPASPEGVDRLLATDTVIDTAYVDNNAASTQRGLGAIEHLLFRSEDPDGRSCSLIIGATAVALESVVALRDGWTVGPDPFVDEFTTEMTSRASLADLVGAIVETLKSQTLFEIGKSLGISAPEPEPGSIQEGDAGAGAATYLAQLDGIQSWLSAGGDDSLIELVRSRSPEVADEIEQELDGALSELKAIGKPMEDLAANDPSALTPLYDHLDRLRTLFEADVVSLLDLTLGFSDSDGDSG
jgi:predicted lipoprotein